MRLLSISSKVDVATLMNESNLQEKFVKGSGRGGQKINKNLSCVQLKHIPTGIAVETQRFRELMNNRKEARKLLALQLDLHFNGPESKIMKRISKIQKQKSKKTSRTNDKYRDKDSNTKDGEKSP